MNKTCEFHISSAASVAPLPAHCSSSTAYSSHHPSASCTSSTPTIPFQAASIIKPHHLSPSIDVNHPSLPGKVLFSKLNSTGWKAKAGNPNVCARVKTTVPVSPEPCLEG